MPPRGPAGEAALDGWLDQCSDTTGLSLFLREWDNATEARRGKLMQSFVSRFQGSTEPGLEQAFSNGASLFLARLNASLRLTYLLPHSRLVLKVRSINVFISATGGKRFLVEFLEVGGALTLLEMLSVPSVPDAAKVAVLEALLTVANSGARYGDLLIESQAKKYVVGCLASLSETVQHSAQEVVMALERLVIETPKGTRQRMSVHTAGSTD